MQCVRCGANTNVTRTREVDGGHAVSRTRVCSVHSDHRFTTLEAPPRESVERVAIRFSDDRLAAVLFDRTRLARDLERYTLGRLDTASLREVEGATIAEIERRLPEVAKPLTLEETAEHPGALTWIQDRFIAEQAEEQLRLRDPMACVLFALATRGRLDHDRAGWDSAGEVLDWLQERFRTHRIQPLRRDAEEAVWYPLSVSAPRPDWVVQHGDPRAGRPQKKAFDYDRMLQSVARAFSGRTHREQQTQLAVDWVLWGLNGQRTVTGGQLATGVLDCLRRVNDIAYLRWVVWAKSIDEIEPFAEEAEALLAQPSPRLRLSPQVRSPRSTGQEGA